MLEGKKSVVDITYLNQQQKQEIKCFLQGAVYAWCNSNNNQPFLFKNLMGGENYYWQNTPLYALYDYYIKLNKDDDTAVKKASNDAGMLLKAVLKDDKNKTFYQDKVEEYGISKKRYRLIS